MKLLFAGDVNFRGLEDLTLEQSERILRQAAPYLREADFIIPNLETPLANKAEHTPIKKSGPNLVCPPECVCFLKAMGAHGVTIANNHIGDYGAGALEETLRLLDREDIRHTGAGENIRAAYVPMIFEKDGTKAAIFSVCEHEFGLAGSETPGSAAYDPRMLMRAIKAEKAEGSIVIVVFHGGNEFNPLPSPDTVERYRLICDMGADAVVGGHTHCPQGYEMYDGKPIIYSLGNFLFRSREARAVTDSWYYGYLCMLNVEEEITFQVIPYRFDPDGTEIAFFAGEAKDRMLDYLCRLSAIIRDSAELERYFQGWAWNHQWVPQKPDDMQDLSSFNSSGHYNLVRCEAHLSQLQMLFQTLYMDQADQAKLWAEKVLELSRMPV